ncbi:MAG: hypothetical protein E7034_07860 [Akkermansiaceae bacterium]|nr:hypothetical protein [Akkermansiaceae bacterium]
MSEIIHYVDSEITAVPAVVKKSGSPKGCGTLSLLPQAAISLTAQAVNFARRKPNFVRAAGENFTLLFRANISPTIPHLSFSNLWNHLPNDILAGIDS